jgi:hypothetical protein
MQMKIQEDEGGAEGAPSMGADAIADYPLPLGGIRWRAFKIKPKIWKRFKSGAFDSQSWMNQLDEQDPEQKKILDYAKKHKNKTIVLQDSSSGKLKAIRRNFTK